MAFVRAYLRASTAEQDVNRARADLERFASEHGHLIASWYTETASGASLERPELARLIRDAHPGDVLLVEQVDRLSRLGAEDWEELKAMLAAKRLRVVAMDLPTSWMGLGGSVDGVTAALVDAVNRMLLDMLAAAARKDYEDRKRRQAQGIAKAKEAGRFKGRGADLARHELIASMLDKGLTWSQVEAATGASRSTIKRVVDARKVPDKNADSGDGIKRGISKEQRAERIAASVERSDGIRRGRIRLAKAIKARSNGEASEASLRLRQGISLAEFKSASSKN